MTGLQRWTDLCCCLMLMGRVFLQENRGRTGSDACFFFFFSLWVKGTFSKWDFITVTVLSVNHPIYVIFPAAPPIMATFAMKNKEINSS